MNRGGKFIFGKSLIRNDYTLHLPPRAVSEYHAANPSLRDDGILQLNIGMELLSVRSSNIAFTMGAKGPLLEGAEHYEGEIAVN